jgi:hypothetical protein
VNASIPLLARPVTRVPADAPSAREPAREPVRGTALLAVLAAR